ncbi:MAG TPA: LLM class flavin-dependent oxidoreductase [Solirubrobacteraceae bacterium]|jgi:alkanesulfonate monooxygenase SsuD/methylene tetrahydromethanopterin reductase-like flavin-dependent oxidoreductase (luciferase family)
MRFDLFYELAVPTSARTDDREVTGQALEQIAAADQAGFDGVWLAEHHFQRHFSHSSAPEVVLGAITQRTARMRIGHAVVLLPFRNPVMVAERIAMLDVLSGGRIDVGVGRGLSPREYEVFGGSIEESRGRVDEDLEIMRRCWSERPASFQGKYWRFDDLDVVPKPVQKPHPPLWTAAVSPETFPLAAEQGLGVLAGPFKPLFMVAEDHDRFVARCQELGKDPRELGFAMTLGVVVLDDGDRARRIAVQHIRWFYEQLLRLTAPVLERGGESYRYYREELRTLRELTGGAPSLEALDAAGMVIAGTPEYAIERFQKLANTGIDHVLCAVQAGGVPHSDAMRTIELMAERVIPALRETTAPAPGQQAGESFRDADLRIFLRDSQTLTPRLAIMSLPLAFKPEQAEGLEALYRIELRGRGGGTWWVRIAGGRLDLLGQDPGQSPDVRISAGGRTWVRMMQGNRRRGLLGRMRVSGDPQKAAAFERLFL